MAITIKDIARAAGVSPSTVSKVLNDSPTIPDSTKEKIRSIMKDLNYHPNQIAKNLAMQSSRNIGVIIPMDKGYAFLNPYMYEILEGIEKVTSKHGYLLTLLSAQSIVDSQYTLEKLFYEKKVDGILISSSVIDKTIYEKLKELKQPFIVLGRPQIGKDLNWIDINNVLAGDIAAEYLIQRGYTKLSFVGNLAESNLIFSNRFQGYKDSLHQHGLDFQNEYLKGSVSSPEDGYEAVSELLKLNPHPDGIVCASSSISFGVIKAIKESGLKIPSDIGVISFDLYPLAQYTDPVLTVVDIDVSQLGANAAQLLIDNLKGSDIKVQSSILAHKLVVNGTTK